MAITINGSGTITGVSAGGLPDDSITAAELSTKTFVSYAVICDQKSQGTSGGTFTSGAWRTRDLNTEISDTDGIVSISSNQFTLAAGNYLIKAIAPARNVSKHQARLYSVTDSASVQVGQTGHTSSNNNFYVSVFARVSPTGSHTYEIQHRSSSSNNGTGFGENANLDVEKYTVVEIYKEA